MTERESTAALINNRPLFESIGLSIKSSPFLDGYSIDILKDNKEFRMFSNYEKFDCFCKGIEFHKEISLQLS